MSTDSANIVKLSGAPAELLNGRHAGMVHLLHGYYRVLERNQWGDPVKVAPTHTTDEWRIA
jgi:hypothetical protein